MLDDFKDIQNISYKIVKNALKKNKISHAYLIETNGYLEGFNFAISFAKSLLCPFSKTNNKECKNCSQCKIIDDNNFIELEIIEADGMWIKKDKITTLQSDFKFKPVIGKYKIYIIKDADKIKESISNTLLKFLEEPVEGIIAILLTENRNKMIKTILSRCQIISLKNIGNSSNKIEVDKNYSVINDIINFIEFYETNSLSALIHENKLILSKIKKREEYEFAFEIILLYYKDVLNYLLSLETNNFSSFIDSIKKTSKVNTISKVLKKIELVVKFKDMIKYNVNLNLLIDNYLLSLEGLMKNENI